MSRLAATEAKTAAQIAGSTGCEPRVAVRRAWAGVASQAIRIAGAPFDLKAQHDFDYVSRSKAPILWKRPQPSTDIFFRSISAKSIS